MIGQAQDSVNKSDKIRHFASPPEMSVVTQRSLRHATVGSARVAYLARSTPLVTEGGGFYSVGYPC